MVQTLHLKLAVRVGLFRDLVFANSIRGEHKLRGFDGHPRLSLPLQSGRDTVTKTRGTPTDGGAQQQALELSDQDAHRRTTNGAHCKCDGGGHRPQP